MDDPNEEKYMSPFISSSYNREKALVYWNELDLEHVFVSLVGEMVSTIGQIRTYVKEGLLQWHAVDILRSQNKFSLAQDIQSITESYKTVFALVDVMYRYNYDWRRKKRLTKGGKTVINNELGLPEDVPAIYASEFSVWYEKEPAEFLRLAIPVIEPEVMNFEKLINRLQGVHDLDKIILASSADIKLTLGLIIDALIKESWILNEEVFLLSSYSRSHSN